jgi:hypothetical protein
VVVVLGILAALAAAATFLVLVSLVRRRELHVSPRLFFVLPPLAFAGQELFERLLHAEASPFQAALEPRFLIGLALQLPFGLLALLAARLLLRVVRTLAGVLRRRTPAAVARLAQNLWVPAGRHVPSIAALALGHPQRGPPVG